MKNIIEVNFQTLFVTKNRIMKSQRTVDVKENIIICKCNMNHIIYLLF
eukprot:UN02251